MWILAGACVTEKKHTWRNAHCSMPTRAFPLAVAIKRENSNVSFHLAQKKTTKKSRLKCSTIS